MKDGRWRGIISMIDLREIRNCHSQAGHILEMVNGDGDCDCDDRPLKKNPTHRPGIFWRDH